MDLDRDQVVPPENSSQVLDEALASADPVLIYQALLSYLSPLLVEEILSAPEVVAVRDALYPGSVLFVDIAGFSSISEALSTQGKVGAEEMGTILNRYFTQLLDIARLYGGQQIKFGGDALLLYFGGPLHVQRAAQCALHMQRQLRDSTIIHTSQGDYPLTIRIGANGGDFYAASLGRPERHEYIFSGRAVASAIVAEGLAAPGEVYIGPGMVSALGTPAEAPASQHGCCLLKDLPPFQMADVPAQSFRPPEQAPSSERIALLASYLPAPVLRHITAHLGSIGLMNEHRLVTVVFINFYGWDSGIREQRRDASLEALQRYFVMVDQTVSYYGGIIARCDPTQEGDKLLIVFGTPVSHENDAEHAVRCALDLNDHLSHLHLGIRHRIGIATGYVFSGNVGSDRHREYTVLGDAANLAARLMTTASDSEILVSASTFDGLQGWVLAEALPPIRVKGFSQPVQVHRVTGWRSAQGLRMQAAMPTEGLIGREAQLTRLENIFAQASSDQGSVVAVTGPAGVGKSAFCAAAAQRWETMGGAVLIGDCEAYGQRIPYLPWLGVLKGLFGIQPDESQPDRLQKIKQAVDEFAPDWHDKLVVLTTLLGMPGAENVAAPELDLRLYQQHLYDFVAALLSGAARRQPLMVMVTSWHWADQASWALLRHIALIAGQSRLVLLLAYRADRLEHKWQTLERGFVELELSALSKPECRVVACSLLRTQAISDRLAERLWAFSNGNPLYLREVAQHLLAQGYVTGDAAGGYDLGADPGTIPVPGSIERIIISRLDSLDPLGRQALKLAAITGKSFSTRILQALAPDAFESIPATLQRLAGRVFICLSQPDPIALYTFCESHVQEVIYTSLAYAQRRDLHRRLGHILESEMAANPNPAEHYALLAHHFDQGQELDKAIEYHLKAGDQARKTYANHEALYHYQRALETLPQLSHPLQPRELLNLHRDYGRICRFLGMHAEAHKSYQLGLALARQSDDRLGQAELLAWESDLLQVQGDGRGALEKARQAARMAEALGDQGLLEVSLEYVGGGHMLLGQFDEALSCFERCLVLSRALGSGPGTLRSLNNLGLIHVSTMHYGPAIAAFTEALALARQLPDHFYVIILANNLGELHQELHDTAAALVLHQEALALARQFGMQDFHCDSLRNLAVDLAQQGEMQRAIDLLKQARTLTDQIGFAIGSASILYNLGDILLASGAEAEAAAIADELATVAGRLRIGALQQKAYLLSGRISHARKAWEQARTAYQGVIELWQREPVGPLGWQSFQALGELYRALGRSPEAEESFTRARQIVDGIVESIADEKLHATALHYFQTELRAAAKTAGPVSDGPAG